MQYNLENLHSKNKYYDSGYESTNEYVNIDVTMKYLINGMIKRDFKLPVIQRLQKTLCIKKSFLLIYSEKKVDCKLKYE